MKTHRKWQSELFSFGDILFCSIAKGFLLYICVSGSTFFMTTWQYCLDSLQIQYSLQMQPKEDVRSESWRALHENWSSFLWLRPWSSAYMSELILTVAPIIFTWKQI